MKTASTLLSIASLGSLLAATSLAFAAEPQTERTRAEVVSETLAARASGTLAPAGEQSIPTVATPNGSQLTRSDVQAQVLTARATGALVPAGEAEWSVVLSSPTTSTLTRADVKASVIAARKQGELIPAGEGVDAESYAHVRVLPATRTARIEAPQVSVAKR